MKNFRISSSFLLGFLAVGLLLLHNPIYATEEEEINALIKEGTASMTQESTSSASSEGTSASFINKYLSATPSAAEAFSFLGLPEPLILPDSPFYILVTLSEKIRLLLTFSPEAKAKFILKTAELRLSEAYKLAEQGKDEKSLKPLEAFQEDLGGLKNELQTLSAQGKDVLDLVRKMEAGVVKEQKVEEFIRSKAPSSSTEFLDSLSSISIEGIKKSLEIAASFKIATPSYELKQKVLEILASQELGKQIKSNLLKIWEENFPKEATPSAEF